MGTGTSRPENNRLGLLHFNGGALRFLAGKEGVEDEQACADDDAAVGYVEVGPMVAEDVNFDEVDDGAIADAVMQIADRAAKDQGESDSSETDAAAESNKRDQYSQACNR